MLNEHESGTILAAVGTRHQQEEGNKVGGICVTVTTMVRHYNSGFLLSSCLSSWLSALYENGVTGWFPGYQNGITLTRSTAAVGPAEFLKDLAKWEIKASETTNFEYNNKPGTGQWKPGY